MPMERTPVLLATDMLGRLNAIARKWRQSRSSVIRDAIQAGLDKLEATEAPQKVSLAGRQTVGQATAHDVARGA